MSRHAKRYRKQWRKPKLIPGKSVVLESGVVVPVFKKGDHKGFFTYRTITLLILPGKVYAKVQERRCREIAVLKIEEEQCGRSGPVEASLIIYLLCARLLRNRQSTPVQRTCVLLT
ncbi:unnamed protein product [Soboliphyme baturini]|uniref:60S ribosomal protein L6 n=1 Tax=Soboliphyme baturini TaxID=241478 RepID=A0A183IGU1_9BILA|nr:unnamed protein product [Soboliphyme baturini]